MKSDVENLKLINAELLAYVNKNSSRVRKLEFRLDMLSKMINDVNLAWSRYENGLIETPEWVKRSQVRDSINQLRITNEKLKNEQSEDI